MGLVTEKGIMKTEVQFDSTKKERYLLRKVWDEKKPIVSLIMTNPSMADVVSCDMTTMYVISNLHKMGYGGVDMLNLSSTITTKLDTKQELKLNTTNVEHILKSAEKSDKVIIAWGKLGENNAKIRLVQLKLLERLKPFEDKLYHIASDTGEFGFHPLAPQIRFTWHLIPFVMPENQEDKKDTDKAQAAQGKQLQNDGQTA